MEIVWIKVFAWAALLFGVVMAASLYKTVRTEEADGFWDYISTVLVACGSFSCAIVAIKVLFS